MYTVSVDIHSASFTMAVFNEKKNLCRTFTCSTTVENLIEQVSEIPNPKTVVVEECHLAQLVKEVLEEHVDKVVVADPVQNRWIAEAEFVNDKKSAIKLGKLYLNDDIREVFHPDADGASIRSEFLHYRDLDGHLTRSKNKLKATFKQGGVKHPSDWGEIFTRKKQLLGQLGERPHLQFRARHFYEMVSSFGHMKQQTYTKLLKRAKKEPVFKLLNGIPGIGALSAIGYMAIIITPHRFSRRNKLWRYAGLGNQYHVSDERVYRNRASRSGNREMKWLIRQQFNAGVLITKKQNRFKGKYARLLQEGHSKKEARREVQRSMLSVVLAVWKKGEPYQDKHVSRRG